MGSANDLAQPQGGSSIGGARSHATAPKDIPSATQVILAALQSSDGIARLTTQTGNAAEVASLVLLTGSAVVVGPNVAAIVAAAGIAGITSASTFDALVTAIANS